MTAPVIEETAAETTEEQPGAAEETVEEETPAEEVEGNDDELPEWARKKLTKANGEAASYRTKLREVEAKLSAAKSPEEFELATTELRETNAQLTRDLIATESGLPKGWGARLQGATEEELIADAKGLAAQIVKKAKTPPSREPSGGLTPNDEDPNAGLSPRELAQRARRKGF